jgi:hypothetical protein
VTVTISMPGYVRGLVAAGDTILAGSSDGVLSTLDIAGRVQGRRVLGKGDIKPALRPDGVLAAAYCDGTLSFFDGDAVINAVQVEDLYPTTLVPWQDDVLLVQGGTAHVYDRAGRVVWAVDFPKRIVGVSVNDRFLVIGAGALVVFERDGAPATA